MAFYKGIYLVFCELIVLVNLWLPFEYAKKKALSIWPRAGGLLRAGRRSRFLQQSKRGLEGVEVGIGAVSIGSAFLAPAAHHCRNGDNEDACHLQGQRSGLR